MTFSIKATDLKNLIKKAADIYDTVNKNSGEWKYITNQTSESIINSAFKNSEGLYCAYIHFTQVPIYKNNYHGMFDTYEKLDNQKSKAM
jgi:hypothetical protein